MKKIKLFGFLCAAVLLMLALSVGVFAAEGSEGLAFTSNGDGTCYVSGLGTCTDTDIVIPAVSPAGDRVTSIGGYAFSGYSSLKSIEIPESVTSIGLYAFYHCISLESIEIPKGVSSIDIYAFSFCSALKSIEIPEGVTSIGDHAFWGCSALRSIEIPEGVTSIGSSAFSSCDALESVTFAENSQLESIGWFAFNSCFALRSIEIPEGVTSIGVAAFGGCSALKSIEIPEGVTRIDDDALAYCSALRSIEIPASVTSIGGWAFSYCDALETIYYHGTEEQWNAIEKGEDWDIDAGIYTEKGTYTVVFLGDSFDEDSVSVKVVTDKEFLIPGDTLEVYFELNSISPITAVAIRPLFDSNVFKMLSNEWLVESQFSIFEPEIVSAWEVETDVCGNIFKMVLQARAVVDVSEITAEVKLERVDDVIDITVVGDTVAVVACPHESFVSESIDGTSHTKTCKRCGYSYIEDHVFDGIFCVDCGYGNVKRGDVNGDGFVSSADAIYLLYNFFYGDTGEYPINQNGDMDGDGLLTSDDAVRLLIHSFYPDEEEYALYCPEGGYVNK